MYELRYYMGADLFSALRNRIYFQEIYKFAVAYVSNDYYENEAYAHILKDGLLIYVIQRNESGTFVTRVRDLKRIRIR